jgi:hypothetical protein
VIDGKLPERRSKASAKYNIIIYIDIILLIYNIYYILYTYTLYIIL